MAKATTSSSSTRTRHVSVLVVTAPGGPRRRAGYSFNKAETIFTAADLGEKGQELVEAWRADPMLKIDERVIEVPDEEDSGGTENQ